MPGFVFNDGGRKAAGYKGTTGDCGIRALAIAAGRPYQEVYDLLAELAKRERLTKRHPRCSSPNNGIKTATFNKMVACYGGRWIPTMGIGTGCKVHLDAAELPSGRIVARVSRHYTAVIDGVIHDLFDPRRSESFMSEPDHGQELKENQTRNVNGVWTRIGGRCVYGYWVFQ